jgi:hypothetical protein
VGRARCQMVTLPECRFCHLYVKTSLRIDLFPSR